jgi:hypothetical protein
MFVVAAEVAVPAAWLLQRVFQPVHESFGVLIADLERDGPVLDFGGTLADVQRASQLALAVGDRVAAGSPGGVSGSQVAGQLFAQRPMGLDVQRQVDRLVRHPHLRIARKGRWQPRRDLLG